MGNANNSCICSWVCVKRQRTVCIGIVLWTTNEWWAGDDWRIYLSAPHSLVWDAENKFRYLYSFDWIARSTRTNRHVASNILMITITWNGIYRGDNMILHMWVAGTTRLLPEQTANRSNPVKPDCHIVWSNHSVTRSLQGGNLVSTRGNWGPNTHAHTHTHTHTHTQRVIPNLLTCAVFKGTGLVQTAGKASQTLWFMSPHSVALTTADVEYGCLFGP